MRSAPKTTSERVEALVFSLFLALLFLLPLPWGSNRDWIWLAEGAFVLLLLGVMLALSGDAWTQALRVSRWPLVALAVWLAFGVLQLIPLPFSWQPLSVDPYRSFLTWMQSLYYAGLFLLTILLVRDWRRLKYLAYTMLSAAFLQALYGGLMTLSGVEWLVFEAKENGRGLATGTFVNRNHFAGFLELGLALGVGLLVAMTGARSARAGSGRARIRGFVEWILGPKMRLRLMLVIMVIALVLSHSRMGNTAFFVSLAAASVLGLGLMRGAPRPVFVLLVSLVVIDIAIVGTWFGFERVVERIQKTGEYDPIASRYRDQDRLDISAETLRASADYRWLGSGGGTFELVFPAYRPANLPKTFDHAHNDYLEFLLEYGIIGVLPLAAFVVLCGRIALRAVRRRRNALMRGAAFATCMALVAYGLHAAVDFNLRIPANAGFFMVLLALGVCASWVPSRRR